MRKILLLVLCLVLVSCVEKVTFIGRIENKYMIEARTEIIPAGYRYDCGINISGKFKCGFDFFLGETNYYPGTYTLVISGDGCQFEERVDENTYNSFSIGQGITLETFPQDLGSCSK